MAMEKAIFLAQTPWQNADLTKIEEKTESLTEHRIVPQICLAEVISHCIKLAVHNWICSIHHDVG